MCPTKVWTLTKCVKQEVGLRKSFSNEFRHRQNVSNKSLGLDKCFKQEVLTKCFKQEVGLRKSFSNEFRRRQNVQTKV